MSTYFEELMTKKSDTELMEYINNYGKYTPEALIAVVNELKSRGQNISDEELRMINDKIEKYKKNEEEEKIEKASKSLRNNVVTDPDAPLLYSQVAVLMFSTIFTTLFGAILLALNIKDTKKKLKVIGIGILFTTFAILIGNLVPHPISVITLTNGAGGYLLVSEFWNKYIGSGTKYRTKQVWIPLIISVVITGLLLIEMSYE